MSTIIRCRRNEIEAIKEGNNWIFEEKDIGKYFSKKNFELFTSSFLSLDEIFDSLGTRYITDNENKELFRIPAEEEIKRAVWQFHLLKSSGL